MTFALRRTGRTLLLSNGYRGSSSLSDGVVSHFGYRGEWPVPAPLALRFSRACPSGSRDRPLFIAVHRAPGHPRGRPALGRRGRGRTFASGSTPWSPDSTRRALSPARAVKIDGIRART